MRSESRDEMLRRLMQPIDGDPRNPKAGDPPPEDPCEPPLRSGQCCANCNAFDHDEMGNAICAAHPGHPIFLGMGTTKTLNAQGQTTPVPVVWGFWPPTSPTRWCREWQWIGPQKGRK